MLNLCVKCYITLCGGFRRLFIQYRCLSECASSFQSHGCNASGIHIHVLDISLASDRCDVIGRTRKKFCPLWNSTSPSPVLDNGLGPAADLGLPACPHPVCFVLLAQRKGNIGFPALSTPPPAGKLTDHSEQVQNPEPREYVMWICFLRFEKSPAKIER